MRFFTRPNTSVGLPDVVEVCNARARLGNVTERRSEWGQDPMGDESDELQVPICGSCGVTAFSDGVGFECANPECEAFGELADS